MKKYYILLLGVTILVGASFIYKINQRSIYSIFEFETIKDEDNIENPLYLYLFFSKENCKSCLEIIMILNKLSKPYKVVGVVPDNELSEEHELRSSTGAIFDIIGSGRFKKIQPLYTPTVIGVSKNKKIYFILPAVPGEEYYIEKFLREFYDRAYPLILVN